MKFSNEDFTALKNAIDPLNTVERRNGYRQGHFHNSDKVKDLDRRYRWDLFWMANGMSVISGDYNDTHIDTALRNIVKEL